MSIPTILGLTRVEGEIILLDVQLKLFASNLNKRKEKKNPAHMIIF